MSARADESYFIGKRITKNSPPDLCRCLLMASSVEAMREFRRGIAG